LPILEIKRLRFGAKTIRQRGAQKKTEEKRRIPIKNRDVEDSEAAEEKEKQMKPLAEMVFIGEIVLQSLSVLHPAVNRNCFSKTALSPRIVCGN
jgi:hypothetical protein